MIHPIFKILCGCLYAIGLIFGRTYNQISVDICIYVCPIICVLCAFIASLAYSSKTIKGRWGKSFNLACFIVYLGLTRMFWLHYDSDYADPFTLCMNDLIAIGNRIQMSYEELNLVIYCDIFFGIILFHLMQVFIASYLKKRRMKLQRIS